MTEIYDKRIRSAEARINITKTLIGHIGAMIAERFLLR